MRIVDIPVLIVGGGGAGLSAANFLADLGIESLLVERHPTTSHLPKAHYINQRSMELFRAHGMSDTIYARSAPRENMGYVTYRTPLGGNGPTDGKIITQKAALGGGEFANVYDLHGAVHPTIIGQHYLEPILREFAEARNPGRVLFRHEFVTLTQSDKGVEAIVRNLDTGEEFLVRCAYLLAADAGKTVGPAIGVNMIGPVKGLPRVQVHFNADLSPYLHDDKSVIHCVINPADGTTGGQLWTYLIAFGPEKWGRYSTEWTIFLTLPPEESIDNDSQLLADEIRKFLQVDADIEVLATNRWFQEVIVADKFGEGRVILIGDAAHKHTPAGGLGLNSGIQDAHNIAWKLAMVLKGQASDGLLRSYEPERRPVVERNAAHSLFYLGSFGLLVGSTGLMENAPPGLNQHQMMALFADTPDGAARRDRMNKVFEIAKSETGHDLDVGYTYASAAIADDGSPPKHRDPAAVVYEPSTRPGCRLPHAWLQQDGQRISTHDLVPMGGWALITGPDGADWCEAAKAVARERGLTINAVQVGSDGMASDPFGRWREVCGISASGALLVRPDHFVCYRSSDGHAAPKAELARYFHNL